MSLQIIRHVVYVLRVLYLVLWPGHMVMHGAKIRVTLCVIAEVSRVLLHQRCAKMLWRSATAVLHTISQHVSGPL